MRSTDQLMLKELHTSHYVWSDGFELTLEELVRGAASRGSTDRNGPERACFGRAPAAVLGSAGCLAWRLRPLAALPGPESEPSKPQYLDRAERQFNEIIRDAPNFVPAYCGLANLANIEHIARPGVFRTRERELRALEMAQRGVQLDPSDSGAHRCLAWSHAMAKQYTQAQMHIELACELNPSDSWTSISAALLLVFCGRPDRGLALMAGPELDIALAPTASHWLYLFDIHVPDRRLRSGPFSRRPRAGRATLASIRLRRRRARASRPAGRGSRGSGALSRRGPRTMVRC